MFNVLSTGCPFYEDVELSDEEMERTFSQENFEAKVKAEKSAVMGGPRKSSETEKWEKYWLVVDMPQSILQTNFSYLHCVVF